MSIALNARIRDLEQAVLRLTDKVKAMDAKKKGDENLVLGADTTLDGALVNPPRRGRPPKLKESENHDGR